MMRYRMERFIRDHREWAYRGIKDIWSMLILEPPISELRIYVRPTIYLNYSIKKESDYFKFTFKEIILEEFN